MRAFQRSRPQCISPRFQCQLGHVTPSHAFPLAMCIFMLPMLVVVAEHMQLATTDHLHSMDQQCVHPCHIFKHAPLVLPSLSNVLPSMTLQDGIVKSHLWCLSHSLSHTSVCRVSSSPAISVPSGLGRIVVRTVVVLLLLMSGDIEMNPGPVGNKLTSDDLGCVLEEVLDVSADWYDLGLQLKVRIGTLDNIWADFTAAKHRLREMLKAWLTTGDNPSWKTLIDALRSRMVGASQLAAALETKYCPVERTELGVDSHPETNVFPLLPLSVPLTTVMLQQTDMQESILKKVTFPAGISSKHHQTNVSEPIKHIRPGAETTVKAQEPQEVISTPMEIQFVSDEEWDPPTKFAVVLTKIAKLLNKTADVDDLKDFLELLCHPRTGQRYINIKLYEDCVTPRDIIKALSPEYINFMHTRLLRQIVTEFGNEQSVTLLKQYEDSFPFKKPLKRMRDPITFEEIKHCHGSKRVKIACNGDIDNTTREDVERVRQKISKSTGIDDSMIVYAHQTPGSVVFTFLVPEMAVSFFSNLDDDSQSDLAKHGILRIEVNDVVTDLQSLEVRTYLSTYTRSGMKRLPLTLDSPGATHCNPEFQQLVSDVGTSLSKTVKVSQLKEFLQTFSHILYPETQYIDRGILNNADSIPHIFIALQPHFINFLNWGILEKAADAFDIEMAPVFQLYKSRLPSHTPLSTLLDPLSEIETSEFKIIQKMRVTRAGGCGIERTLGDVQVVKEAMEKATGIDQDFIIYAYWEGGFNTHQFTFLIPKSICGIFGELCAEDLAILAEIGVQRLEVDYDTVADNIQELCEECPQTVAPVRADNRLQTKNFGLEHFIPEGELHQTSEEEFSYLNNLITSTPAGKLQEVCSNDFLKVFAKKMGSWKDLAPYLGINQWDLEDLAGLYPGDEEEQKYVALLNWKSIDDNSATYERLVECFLTHGHVDDAKELLLHFQGSEVQKAQDLLRQRFLNDLFSKRKLWNGAPKLLKFDRRFGIVQNATLLSELDYTSCYEMMDQFPSEIQEVSMKSMLNKISQRKVRVFIFKGPPGCGKTELISRVCRYWSKHYALRKFSLVLYVNIWDFHQGCTLQNLIDRQFVGSTVSSAKICRWVEEEKGNEILFILDGFCRKYLYGSPLQKGGILSDIIFGHSCFSRSTIVISTTCSDFFKPFLENFTQFEILGLSGEQMGKEVIKHFDSERAVNFLGYLSENPEIKALVSSPSYLIGTMYVFAHIPYDDLPVTWTQLYTSLIVLISEWHKTELIENFPHDSLLTKFRNRFLKRGRKVSKDLATDSLQSQFQNTLLVNSKKVIKDSRDLIATVGRLLIHDVEDNDHELPDYNSAVPCLEHFLLSVETFINPDHKKLDKALKDKDAFTYFWYKRNIVRTRFESVYVTAEQQVLSSITAELGMSVVTTHDMLSFLRCLPYMQDSHMMVLNKSFIGAQAARELSRFLAADSWTNDYSGITHLCLTAISDEAVSTIALALKTNNSLQKLNLRGNSLTVTGAIALVRALEHNRSLEELNLRDSVISAEGVHALVGVLQVNQSLQNLKLGLSENEIMDESMCVLLRDLQVNQSHQNLDLSEKRITNKGACALATALRVNQSLQELNLRCNLISDEGAHAVAAALQVNQSLQKLNLGSNQISDEGGCAVAAALQVNQSLQELNLRNNKISADGVLILAGALTVNQNIKLDLCKNKISDENVCVLVEALQVNQSHQKLMLNLSWNKITGKGSFALATALRVNKSLKELNLWGNEIKDEGACALSEALQVNQDLLTLNLSENQISDEGARALSEALQVNQSLQELEPQTQLRELEEVKDSQYKLKEAKRSLSVNQIKDEGACALSEALRVNNSLHKINLRGNQIKEGACVLSEALRVNQSLQELNLSWNQIEDKGAYALYEALRVNQSLQELNLFWCTYYLRKFLFKGSIYSFGKPADIDDSRLRVWDNDISYEGRYVLRKAELNRENLKIRGLDNQQSKLDGPSDWVTFGGDDDDDDDDDVIDVIGVIDGL